jgi:pyruvate-ferredoxin/flavodoxin oxidoreductase
MLLAGSSRILAGTGLSQVASLLGSDLPIKILVLADLDLGLGTRADLDTAPAPGPDAMLDLGLLALARRSACIAQTSLGAPDHFMDSVRASLDFGGPALLHVHAPSPGRHGFPTDRTLEQARLAVATRTFPLFRYDPTGEGVFGTRIDLRANPEPLITWVTKNASSEERGAKDEDESGLRRRTSSPSKLEPRSSKPPGEGALTPAAWALGEARFRDWLTPLEEDAPDPLPVDAYLDLDERSRGGRTAYVSLLRSHREPVRYRVAPALIHACSERRDAWRLLQELGGLVTPFTERVRREAEEQVALKHQSELASQAAEYEERIAALRDELQDELRHDIRERLMAMAGYRHAGGQEAGGRAKDLSSRPSHLGTQRSQPNSQ